MIQLTGKQKEIYECLQIYIDMNGYPPSIREICDIVSLKSTSTVHKHLGILEKNGYIKRDPTKPRALIINTITSQNKENINIPILGCLNENDIFSPKNIIGTFPIYFDLNIDEKDLFSVIMPDNTFEEEGILKGDNVILKRIINADEGDIYLTIKNNEHILKKFFKNEMYFNTSNSYQICKLIMIFRNFD